MITKAEAIYATRYLLWDFVRDIIYFPIWWYSAGLILAGRWFSRGLRAGTQRLALVILFRYWFKPMYGQTDWQGKIISFFMRTVTLLWKFFLWMIWLAIMLALLAAYIIILPAILYELFFV
ncbi:MAG: hypothetical protein ACKKL5_02580 [Candidatus Komeilibacteria bacterium]